MVDLSVALLQALLRETGKIPGCLEDLPGPLAGQVQAPPLQPVR